MAQATDIVLGGAGYMIVPGSYSRSTDAEPETRPGIWQQTDFVGGQRQAFQLARDRGWDSVGVGPAFDGQGVEPWPAIELYADTGIAGRTVTSGTRVPTAIAGNRAYYGNDRYLYRGAPLTNPGPWSGFNQAYDGGAGTTITDISPYQDNLAVCFGTTKDIQIFNVGAATASDLSTGEKGGVCVGYAGRLIYSNPAAGSQHILKLTTGGAIDTRALDSPIVRMALHGGKAIIATRSSLYQLGGRGDPTTGKWLGEPEPLFTHGLWAGDQDYHFLLSYGGKLYTWLAGQVMEWNPNSGSSKQGWRSTGLSGATCYGATVAGDRLIVCLANRQGRGEVWAFDGTGWWLINTRTSQHNCWPLYVAGTQGYDLALFRSGSTVVNVDLARLVYRDAAQHNYRSSGTYTTSLITAGEPAHMKLWQRMGCSFEAPEPRGNTASTDQVTVKLRYSIDNGVTWSDAVTATQANPADRLLRLETTLPGGSVESASIQLAVDWSSVSDWAPTLNAIWVHYEILAPAIRQRRWKMDVVCRDGLVLRDGSTDARSGRQIAADLWSSWELAETLTMRDIDYAITGKQYGVRILRITEKVRATTDAERWGDSIITLELAEV